MARCNQRYTVEEGPKIQKRQTKSSPDLTCLYHKRTHTVKTIMTSNDCKAAIKDDDVASVVGVDSTTGAARVMAGLWVKKLNGMI